MSNALPISPQQAATELLRRRAARTKFTNFCEYIAPEEPPATHHKLICNACDRVTAGEIRRLLIFMPPGSAKSTYASVRFPAFFLGKYSKKSIICTGYGDDLVISFGRKVRNIVASPEYHLLFHVTLAEDQRSKGEWETSDGGSYYATSVGGGITGRRADIGLIDDPVKGRKESDSELVRRGVWDWYKSDFITRLKPGAAQIIIQTRWHEDDLSGRILPSHWQGESGTFKGFDGQDWTVICLPAQARGGDALGRDVGGWLWPEWFTPQFWTETKQAQQAEDIRNWNSLYQQVPAPEDGTFFKREWFKRFRLGEEPKELSKYGTSDYALTKGGGDFTEHSIGGFDGYEDLWFLDWWSGQETADVWVEEQFKLVKKHSPQVWVAEGGQIRRAMEPYILKRMREPGGTYFRLEWLPTGGDKKANARGFQGLCAQGKVHVPYCEWGNELIEQLIVFDAGKYDDKVDNTGIYGRILDQTYGPRQAAKAQEPILDVWGRPIVQSNWITL